MINKENSEGRSPRSREQTAINVRETTPENSIAIEVSPPRMSFSGSPIKKGPLPAQSTPLDKELAISQQSLSFALQDQQRLISQIHQLKHANSLLLASLDQSEAMHINHAKQAMLQLHNTLTTASGPLVRPPVVTSESHVTPSLEYSLDQTSFKNLESMKNFQSIMDFNQKMSSFFANKNCPSPLSVKMLENPSSVSIENTSGLRFDPLNLPQLEVNMGKTISSLSKRGEDSVDFTITEADDSFIDDDPFRISRIVNESQKMTFIDRKNQESPILLKRKHEEELWEIREKNDQEIKKVRAEAEMELKRLKEAFEETMRMQAEQKTNGVKEISTGINDVSWEIHTLHEKIEKLEEENAELKRFLNEAARQWEIKEKGLNDSLEKCERVLKEERNHFFQMKKQMERELLEKEKMIKSIAEMDQEKKEIRERCEALQRENTKMELEVQSKKEKEEQVERECRLKDEVIDSLQNEMEDMLQTYEKRLSETKIRFNKILEETRTENQRLKQEVALSEQENQFIQIELGKLKSSYEEIKNKANNSFETLETTRTISELQEKLKNAQKSEERLTEEISEVKKAMNEQVECLKGALQHSEEHVEIIGAEMARALVKFNQEKEKIVRKLENDEKEKLQNELQFTEKIKEQEELIGKLTSENEKTWIDFQKEKALSEKKILYLESQRNAMKDEMRSSQEQFEMTLSALQTMKQKQQILNSSFVSPKHSMNTSRILLGLDSKDESDVSHYCSCNGNNLSMSEDVNRYKTRLREAERRENLLRSKVKESKQELDDKCQEIERLKRCLNEKSLQLQLSDRGVERNKDEQEHMAQERFHKKLIEIEKGYEIKIKVLQESKRVLEGRLQEAERKRVQLFCDHEKEQAKWNNERSQLVGEISELKLNTTRNETMRETLIRENEKLRSNSRENRRGMVLMTTRRNKSPVSNISNSSISLKSSASLSKI